MQAARPSQQQMTNTSRKALLIFCVAFWILIFSVVASICWMQWQKYTAYVPQIAAAAQQLEQEKAKGKQLQQEQSYNESDAYVEKVAREQLGLVKPDEILIYDSP